MTDKSETPKILEEISQAGAKGNGRLRNQKNARRRLFVVTLLLGPLITTILYLGFQLRAWFGDHVWFGVVERDEEATCGEGCGR